MISITSKHVRIPLGAGIEVPAYRATPAAGPIRASVLVLSEIWSVNPNIRSICDRLARNGIAALAPDLYRGGKAPQDIPVCGCRARRPAQGQSAPWRGTCVKPVSSFAPSPYACMTPNSPIPHRSKLALPGDRAGKPGARTVVRSLLRSPVHSHTNRHRAQELAWEWVGAKWPRLMPSRSEMESGHFERALPDQELSVSTSGDGSVWSLSVAYSERRGTRTWMTRALVADADNADVVGLQTSCSDLADTPLVVAPPRLLGAWVERLELEDGALPVLGDPREVGNQQQLAAFCDHVLSDTRTLPVIALANKPNSRYYGVDPQGLAQAVRGLAHVACVAPSVAADVKARLGQDFGVVAGAARIYAPRFGPAAALTDHPLLRDGGVAGTSKTEDAGAFRRLLCRRICALSVDAGAGRDAFP